MCTRHMHVAGVRNRVNVRAAAGTCVLTQSFPWHMCALELQHHLQLIRDDGQCCPFVCGYSYAETRVHRTDELADVPGQPTGRL